MPAFRWDVGASAYVNLRTGERLEKFTVDETEPTPLNTGPQIPLTSSYTGTMNISSPTTISGVDITGRVVVQNAATGVVIIEHCRIDASSLGPATSNIVSVQPNTGATVIIRYCEIIGTIGMIGIGVRRFTAYRNNIHHVEDGFRMNNFSGTGQAADTHVYANYIGPVITRVPDPFIVRDDERTHSDPIQIEGGDGINIHGNTVYAMNTTDGTSNIENFSSATGKAVPAGTPNSSPHPQALSAILINPGVSAVTNIQVKKNWIYGGAVGFNFGATTAGTTGEISGNRFQRGGQWYNTPYIAIDSSATGLTTPAGTNVFMDDGTEVPISRNW